MNRSFCKERLVTLLKRMTWTKGQRANSQPCLKGSYFCIFLLPKINIKQFRKILNNCTVHSFVDKQREAQQNAVL